MGNLHELRRPHGAPRGWRTGLAVAALAAAAAYGFDVLGDSHAAQRPSPGQVARSPAIAPAGGTSAGDAESFTSRYHLQAVERAEPIATF